MKAIKIILSTMVITALLASTTFAYANAERQTPAEILSSISNYTLEEIREMSAKGKRLGEIAEEIGELENFKAKKIAMKKQLIQQKVASGQLSKEQADTLVEHFESKVALNCDENCGTYQMGRDFAVKFGKGAKDGMGAKNNGPQGKNAQNGNAKGKNL